MADKFTQLALLHFELHKYNNKINDQIQLVGFLRVKIPKILRASGLTEMSRKQKARN